jgi:hypothetical protein
MLENSEEEEEEEEEGRGVLPLPQSCQTVWALGPWVMMEGRILETGTLLPCLSRWSVITQSVTDCVCADFFQVFCVLLIIRRLVTSAADVERLKT